MDETGGTDCRDHCICANPDFAVDCWCENNAYRVNATMIEFNKKGAFLRTSTQFDVGEIVAVKFKCPSTGTNVQIIGKVAWRRFAESGPDLPAGVGIRFLSACADA